MWWMYTQESPYNFQSMFCYNACACFAIFSSFMSISFFLKKLLKIIQHSWDQLNLTKKSLGYTLYWVWQQSNWSNQIVSTFYNSAHIDITHGFDIVKTTNHIHSYVKQLIGHFQLKDHKCNQSIWKQPYSLRTKLMNWKMFIHIPSW